MRTCHTGSDSREHHRSEGDKSGYIAKQGSHCHTFRSVPSCYLDTAAYEGSDLMTKVTLQLLSPSDFSSNFSVTGRVCRVQDAGREFNAEKMAV